MRFQINERLDLSGSSIALQWTCWTIATSFEKTICFFSQIKFSLQTQLCFLKGGYYIDLHYFMDIYPMAH